MRLAFLLFLFAFPLFAEDTISLRNDREGESYYAGRKTTKAIRRALEDVPGTVIVDSFRDLLADTEENKLCAFDVVQHMRYRLEARYRDFEEMPGVLHYLRLQNEIDDVTLKLLLDAHGTLTKKLYLPKYEDRLFPPSDKKKLSEMIKAVGAFKGRLKTSCFDEAYRSLYNELTKIDKHIKGYHVEAVFVEAYKAKLIDVPTYKSLERARVTEVERGVLTLKGYYQKVQSLRTQYPLRDPEEKSEFVTDRFNKEKKSRRQRLLENYSDLQIMLMSNVVKKLRSRLDSPRIEILVYDQESLQETIPLEPMERFRFAIKILRKEMAMLSLNTYFAGRQPDYIDLMTAAYETGTIPSLELEEIAGLQDIWSPKKTFWEKAQVWVRMASSVSSVVIPPPYGFIPALALVVIEATVGKKDSNSEDNTSLF